MINPSICSINLPELALVRLTSEDYFFVILIIINCLISSRSSEILNIHMEYAPGCCTLYRFEY